MSVVVVDYGVGNLNSVHNILRKVGVKSTISSDPRSIANASTLILPGVGSFGAGMAALTERGLVPVLKQSAEAGNQIVGICLGMQLLGSSSDEAECEGLNLIGARFRRFDTADMKTPLPVPHMGWNLVTIKKDSEFLQYLPEPSRFYFVHSYFADDVSNDEILLTANYGQEFVAAYQRDNVIGFQFHPEKSHKYGMSLLKGLFARHRNSSSDSESMSDGTG